MCHQHAIVAGPHDQEHAVTMMEAFVGRLVAVPVVPTVVPAVGLELDQVKQHATGIVASHRVHGAGKDPSQLPLRPVRKTAHS